MNILPLLWNKNTTYNKEPTSSERNLKSGQRNTRAPTLATHDKTQTTNYNSNKRTKTELWQPNFFLKMNSNNKNKRCPPPAMCHRWKKEFLFDCKDQPSFNLDVLNIVVILLQRVQNHYI